MGHQLDWVYGNKIYGPNQFASQESGYFGYELNGQLVTFGGTKITAGDVLTLVVTPADTSLAAQTFKYTVKSGDTFTSLASTFASDVNGNAILTDSPIFAFASNTGAVLKVDLNSTSVVLYSISLSPGASETLTLGNHDWQTHNLISPQCKYTGALFTGQQDSQVNPPNGKYICSSLTQATIGNVLTLKVTDTALAGGSYTFMYTTTNKDTSQTVLAANIAAAINSNATLKAAGITATPPVTALININSGTQNATSYTAHWNTGATETITMSSVRNGYGDTLSNPYVGMTNTAVLQSTKAWDYYYNPLTSPTKDMWAEIWAEEVGTSSGQVNNGSSDTPDTYLQSSKFNCSQNTVRALVNTGNLPTANSYHQFDCP
jgi:hypothetical protein